MKSLIVALVCALWLIPAAALAQAVSIAKLSVTKAPLKVAFQVDGAFSPEMEEAVKSGLPASFLFAVKLERVNPILPNEGAGAWEFRHTVKYNSLFDEYDVTIDEAGAKTAKVKGAEAMKRLMSGFEATLADAKLAQGAAYRLSVKAKLAPMDLPFIPNYMKFFGEVFDFDTGWSGLDFTN